MRDFKTNDLHETGIFSKDLNPAKPSELYQSAAFSRALYNFYKSVKSSEVSLEHRLFLHSLQLRILADSTGIPNNNSRLYKKKSSAKALIGKPIELTSTLGNGTPGSYRLAAIPLRFVGREERDSSDTYTNHMNTGTGILCAYGNGENGRYSALIPIAAKDDIEYSLILTAQPTINFPNNYEEFTTGIHHTFTLIIEHTDDTSKQGLSVEEPVFIEGTTVRFTSIRVACDITTTTISDLLSAIRSVTIGSARDFEDGGIPLNVDVYPEHDATIMSKTLSESFMAGREDKPFYLPIQPRSTTINLLSQKFLFPIPPSHSEFPYSTYGDVNLSNTDFYIHHPFLYTYSATDLERSESSYNAYFINTGTYGFVIDRDGIETSIKDPSPESTGSIDFSLTSSPTSSTASFVFIPQSLSDVVDDETSPPDLDPTFDPTLKVPLHDVYKPMRAANPYLWDNISDTDPGDGTHYVGDTFLPLFTVTQKTIEFVDGTKIDIDDYLDFFTHGLSQTYVIAPTGESLIQRQTRLSDVLYDAIEELPSSNDAHKTLFAKELGPVVEQGATAGSLPGKDSLTYIAEMFTALVEMINRRSYTYPDIVRSNEIKINPQTVSAVGFNIIKTTRAEDVSANLTTYDASYARLAPLQYSLPLAPIVLGDPTISIERVYASGIIPTGFINIIGYSDPSTSSCLAALTITDVLGAKKKSFTVGYEYTNDPGKEFDTQHTSIDTDGEITIGSAALTPSDFHRMFLPTQSLYGDTQTDVLNSLFTAASAQTIEVAGHHRHHVTSPSFTDDTSAVFINNIHSNTEVTHRSQSGMHDPITRLFQALGEGFAESYMDISAGDTANGVNPVHPDDITGDSDKDALIRGYLDETASFAAEQQATGSPATETWSSEQSVRRNKAVANRAFTNVAGELSFYMSAVLFSEEYTTSGGAATTYPPIFTYTRFRKLLLAEYTFLKIAEYLKMHSFSGFNSKWITHFTTDIPYYKDALSILASSANARHQALKNTVIAFSTNYTLGLTYNAAYEILENSTYGNYLSMATDTVFVSPSQTGLTSTFTRANYEAAPAYALGNLSLYTPSIVAVYTDGQDDFKYVGTMYTSSSTSDSDVTADTYNMSTYFRLLSSNDIDSGSFARSVGLLSKLKKSGSTTYANEIQLFPFAVFSLPVKLVRSESDFVGVGSGSHGASELSFNIDAAPYIKKVYAVRRDAATGGTVKIDITNDYIGGANETVVDFGLLSVLADRDDDMNRNSRLATTNSPTAKDYSADFMRRIYTETANTKMRVIQLAALATLGIDSNAPDFEIFDLNEGIGRFSSSDIPIEYHDAVFHFDNQSVLIDSPNKTSSCWPRTAAVKTIRMRVKESDLIATTFRQTAKKIELAASSSFSSPVHLDHEIEVSPLSFLADIHMPLSFEIELYDDLPSRLAADGLVLDESTMTTADYTDLTTENIPRLDIKTATAQQDINFNNLAAGDAPELEIPLTVSIGYMPLYYHETTAQLQEIDFYENAVTIGDPNSDLAVIKVKDTLLTTEESTQYAAQETRVVRPGSVVITERFSRTKVYTTTRKV